METKTLQRSHWPYFNFHDSLALVRLSFRSVHQLPERLATLLRAQIIRIR